MGRALASAVGVAQSDHFPRSRETIGRAPPQGGNLEREGVRVGRAGNDGRGGATRLAAEGLINQQADRSGARLEGRALLFRPGVDGHELIGLNADQDGLAFPGGGASTEVFDITA